MKTQKEEVEKVWRLDDEDHEYLIPVTMSNDFDYFLAEVMNDSDAEHVRECWNYLEKTYKKYRMRTER